MRERYLGAKVLLVAASVLVVFSPLAAAHQERVQRTSTSTGKLNIRISGARVGTQIVVRAESRHRGRTDTLPPGETAVSFNNLELGANYVSATQDGLLSGLVEAILDASRPEADVHLDLDVNHAELLVPVGDATVRPLRLAAPPYHRAGSDLQPHSPGRYDLSAIQPGTPLLIRAEGFAPACRAVTRNAVDVVQLEPGRQVHVTLPPDVTPAVMTELTALSEVPGSNCLIPFWAFNPTLDRTSTTPRLVTMTHFPSSHRFRLIRSGLPERRIFVPQSGNVIVESQ
jgi:hypothetical protein